MKYIKKAQEREREEKKWNLLLIPGVLIPLVTILYLSFLLMDFVHGIIYIGQNFTVTSRGIGAIMATVAPFCGTLSVSLFLGNLLVWFVLPARRKFDSEASNVPGTSFVESQKQFFSN